MPPRQSAPGTHEAGSHRICIRHAATQIDAAVADASAQVRQYEIQAKATAERVAHYTALTLWVAFASSLLGMLAALLGGWLGSDRVQRVYHLRTYAPLAPRGMP